MQCSNIFLHGSQCFYWLFLNGTLRDLGYKEFLGDFANYSVCIYIGYIIYNYPPSSPTQAMFVGLFWVAHTLCFEFGFGRMRGNSWSVLLADYNIFCGRIWVLVPIFILTAPYIFYRMYH